MSGTFNQFNFSGFCLRVLVALILVYSTYNPSGYSYFGWVSEGFAEQMPFKVFLAVVLLIGWMIFLRATANSLGGIGLLLVGGFFGTMIWLLADWGVLPADNKEAIIYLVEFVAAAILAVGMSWSHIRRRMSGQVDTDEIER
jgi:hypothetical protein